ncbi:GNAT family N-acetyltransferase [Paenibacillus koleovorans]|uniref:GNAT family N-acetyltransferase n=1 Tax=Paenibacillus koleovorans TaxID=121608 RepID=UPI001FE7D44D|nr:GNAT family N-acetyltransferase [Paenibacillus koleovorans]
MAESGSRSIEIRWVGVNDPSLAALIDRLDAELQTIYPAEAIFGLDLEAAHQGGEVVFAAAYDGDRPVGCGALRPLGEPGMLELKRFYVDPAYRGRGVASGILRFLEDHARREGYSIVRLETGELLEEAVRLYRKFGYTPIDRYGPYVHCEESYCMQKRL